MVSVAYHPHFEKTVRKIRDAGLKERVKQQILRIVEEPFVGKPMRYYTGRPGKSASPRSG